MIFEMRRRFHFKEYIPYASKFRVINGLKF